MRPFSPPSACWGGGSKSTYLPGTLLEFSAPHFLLVACSPTSPLLPSSSLVPLLPQPLPAAPATPYFPAPGFGPPASRTVKTPSLLAVSPEWGCGLPGEAESRLQAPLQQSTTDGLCTAWKLASSSSGDWKGKAGVTLRLVSGKASFWPVQSVAAFLLCSRVASLCAQALLVCLLAAWGPMTSSINDFLKDMGVHV